MSRKCPVCNHTEISRIHNVKMSVPVEWRLPREYDVAYCNACGFCFANTTASIDDYNHYYQNCNSYSGTPVDDSAWSYLNEVAGSMLKEYLKSDAHIMDMGFGKGAFLRYIKSQGFHNIVGVDPSSTSVENVRSYGIEAKEGSIFDDVIPTWEKQIDCVCIFDVLEHLLYPSDGLKNVISYLREGGFLLVSVPNYGSLENCNLPVPGMFNHEHINYFSYNTLNHLMSNHNFSLVDVNEDCETSGEIIALYKKVECTKENFAFDELGKGSIEEFFKRADLKVQFVNEKLSTISDIKEVYVWGTGSYTMWLLANSKLKDYDITFVDNNQTKVGSTIDGIPVISPDKITDEVPIIVCSMLYGEVIHKQILEMKLGSEVIIL